MSEDDEKSTVEIVIGQNRVHIEGTEKFVSDELSTILDRISLAHSEKPSEPSRQTSDSNNGATDGTPGQQVPLSEEGFTTEEAEMSGDDAEPDPLKKVAEAINVPVETLRKHFYVEEDNSELDIHVQDPTKISAKYALLGYCTIREVLLGETVHNNKETKKKLIDVEKVDIDAWGRKLLYRLRQKGYIKDDPNTDRSRNKPFKITPQGRKEFVDWLRDES